MVQSGNGRQVVRDGDSVRVQRIGDPNVVQQHLDSGEEFKIVAGLKEKAPLRRKVVGRTVGATIEITHEDVPALSTGERNKFRINAIEP
ncbi:hypothetical protein A2118_01705 [Candidatus Kaiserbacteria bacterium GWA2_50_9]|uniref:Uncharacterized protein n=1 Tax=Candidatus Kaiserbacteria bacterium GWA2_50_9 TaxID=1798474 RepID=A0A1F6BVV2_9BACT|nr:MAG: hypothetical protein A2118_01705 [Candidatus Kaiserbacteria bacterium GWA2_50_9]